MDCVAQTGLLPVWVSFTLRDDQHLAGGETIAQAVKAVTQHQLARWSREESVGEIWEILFCSFACKLYTVKAEICDFLF